MNFNDGGLEAVCRTQDAASPLSIKTEDICPSSAPLASYTTLPARRGCCTSPRRYPSIQPAPRIPNGEAQAWHVSLVHVSV